MYRISTELLSFFVISIIVLFLIAIIAIRSKSKIKQELYDKDRECKELQNEIQKLNALNKIKTDELQEDFQNTLKDIVSKKEAEIIALNKEFQKLLDELRIQYEKENKRLKLDFANKLTLLNKKYNEDISLSNKKSETIQSQLKKVETDYTDTLKFQSNYIALKDEYTKLKIQFETQLKINNHSVDLKNRIADLNKKNIELTEKNLFLVEELHKLQEPYYNYKNSTESLINELKLYKKNVDVKYYEMYVRKYLGIFQNFTDFAKEELSSNKTAIPYMAGFIADLKTIDFDKIALSLSWGENKERRRKVESLNSLKKEAKDRIEELKWSEYQLEYLLELYPTLADVIDTEFSELNLSYDDITDFDPVIKWLSKEEWKTLSNSEKNQLALDRYVESRKKSKWQIGRDYELYCGYNYEKNGYKVDYYGNYKGLEDLGRDLIISCFDEIKIIQCKYWSQSKKIHEKHIMQLYGTVVEYNIEHNANAKGVLITNIELSDKAKQFAQVLNIEYIEKHEIQNFPRIKCNVAKDDFGNTTYIYHLPMDLNYDKTKIENKGEFMALTVAEAEKAGFRRAYKWHGNI